MSTKSEVKSILEAEGLSPNAARVYLALLGMGSGTFSSIATRSGLHPQSVKNSILELKQQGLVSGVGHKLSRTLYKPAPPYLLSRRMHERHERYVKLLPELVRTFESQKTRFFSAYQTKQACLSHLELFVESMPRGSTLRIKSFPGTRFIEYLATTYEALEKVRLSKNISKQVLLGPADVRLMQARPDALREVRSAYRQHKAIEGSLVTFISPGRVFQFFFDVSEPTCTVLESKQFAESELRLFEYLWKEAEGVK